MGASGGGGGRTKNDGGDVVRVQRQQSSQNEL